MDASTILRRARTRSGLTLRALAELAGTSHSTLATYESGAKVPTVATLDRIVRAAGWALEPRLTRRATEDRGAELEDVLHLAEQFPARHAPTMTFPVFPARLPPTDSEPPR